MSLSRGRHPDRPLLAGRTSHLLAMALGPSLGAFGDVRRMAPRTALPDPWDHMSPSQRTGEPRARHRVHIGRGDVLRALVVILSLIALLVTSSALNLVPSVQAAEEESPKRAVIVAGPVHGLTSKYRGYAVAMAEAAEAQGMAVTRIFHPYATKKRVKRHANGADLFIYVGHGNGWPSPFGPFQERTKNGIGINPGNPARRTTSNVLYKGADWIRENIEFAPNAVVILSHLSYASGNASSGMPIPTRNVAIQRVDNFANGFLAAGARVVWALGWQPGADVIDALHEEDATMDAVFQTRYRSRVNPLNGWIGWRPGYSDSERVPGAVVHIDPDPTYGFLRGLTGDLSLTTNEWRESGSVPDDTVAPVVSGLSVAQSPVTVATGGESLPVFTPNGDGISDTIRVRHTLDERAFLDVKVQRDGNVVRHLSTWSLRGTGTTAWDGRRDDGKLVGEASFKIVITPRDRAGNVGEPQAVRVKVLNALHSPTARPPLFNPADGDRLAARVNLRAKLAKPGTVSWLVRDSSGTIVRHGIDAEERPAGDVLFAWDGTDDEGQLVPKGRYTARVKLTRPKGTYGHDIDVRLAAFRLTPSTWVPRRGTRVTLVIEAAEPVKGKPIVTASRKGLKRVGVKVRRISPKKFSASYWVRRAGTRGPLWINVRSTDIHGGTQAQAFKLRVR